VSVQRRQRVGGTRPYDHVLAPRGRDRVATNDERDVAACRVRPPGIDADALTESAARWLESEECELRCDVARRQAAALRTGRTTLQQIVGEKGEVSANAGRGDRASGCLFRR